MKKIISIIISIALTGFLIYAITFHKKEIPVEKPGKVVATPVYERYFGAAPSVDEGMAYAFVIYFPSSKTPGKVVPFPFFTFAEGSLKKVAIVRLLGGMDKLQESSGEGSRSSEGAFLNGRTLFRSGNYHG